MNTQETHTTDLRKKGKSIKASIWIGKKGLEESVIDEIKKQLDKKGLVKVRFMKSFVDKNDRKKTADELSNRTNSKLIEIVGFNAVLLKEDKYFK